ncbi:MAG TPA: hypothetical protein VJU84_08670 [Pyrinomonadaceae bacterium]|nr:hypothetical protein [Pyrinomonadaceae bacterium]
MTSSSLLVSFSPAAAGLVLLGFIDPGFVELKNFAPTIIMTFLILWTVLRITPTWKEVKMREMDIREKEIAQRSEQSAAVMTLAEVTREIAIEQKNTTEALRIAERVEIKRGERLAESVQDVTSRLEAIETKTAQAHG